MAPHCNDKTLEQTIRNTFRDRWDGWLESYQPGLGGGAGIPDTQIMAHPPVLIPIELKRGTLINGRLFSDKIRPVQVSWHTRLAAAGGKSYFLIGAMDAGMLKLFMSEAMLVLATRESGLLVGVKAVLNLPSPSSYTREAFSTAIRNFLL